MAYYTSDFYDAKSGEYYHTPYSDSYDIVPFQEPVTYSGYEFREPGFIEYNSTAYTSAYDPSRSMPEIKYSNHSITEPKLIEYNLNPYLGAYDPFFLRSEVNNSTYSFTEPKLIEYNPNPYGTGYYAPETQYAMSYSMKSDVDDIEFEEYDPTPYGGGYDLALTYGRPLAPSDQICYPRSDLEYSNVPSSDDFIFGSIPSPYGKDGPEPTKATEEITPTENPLGEPVESRTRDDYHPWSGYGYGCGNEDYGSGNEYGKKVGQTKCDYGIDAMDLCESLFGHWPCLYKNNGKNYDDGDEESGSEEQRQENQWMGAADCLFGNEASGPGYNYEWHFLE